MLTINKVTVQESDITTLTADGEELNFLKKDFVRWRNNRYPYPPEHKLPRVGEYDWWDLHQDVQLDVRNYILTEVLESGIHFQRVY